MCLVAMVMLAVARLQKAMGRRGGGGWYPGMRVVAIIGVNGFWLLE
jgi:hypothetical protein